MPRLILDRWKIQPTIKAQTIYRAYRGEGGTGSAEEMAAHWKDEARARFSSLGKLAYASLDTQVQDSELRSPVEWPCRRSW